MKGYKIGVKLEYKIVDVLRKGLGIPPKKWTNGKYTIIRTAGSHTPVDVVVLEHRGRGYYGIQCKSKKDG